MTDQKWRSPTGHPIARLETDKLPPKCEQNNDVQDALDDEQKPVGYLIDNGAGSAMDKFQNYYPTAIHEAQIIERGGSITPLYKRALVQQQTDTDLLEALKTAYNYVEDYEVNVNAFNYNKQVQKYNDDLKVIKQAIARAEQKGGL